MSMSIWIDGTGVEVPQEAVPAMLARFEHDAEAYAADVADADVTAVDRATFERDGETARQMVEGLREGTDVELSPSALVYVRAALCGDSSAAVVCQMWTAGDWPGLAGLCKVLSAFDALAGVAAG